MIDHKLLEYLESYLTERRLQRFNNVLANRTYYYTVATEDVYQQHNTSAVLRSCDVFGIQELQAIYVNRTRTIDKEIAMGAQKWVDVVYHNSSLDCIKSMKSKGYQIVATTPHIDDCLLTDFDATKKSCFFFGTEIDGLSEDVMKNADSFLKIPMVGFTESLNISVSAAIILQDLTTRLRRSNADWQLKEDEKSALRLKWCKRTIKSIDEIISHYNNHCK